MADVVVLRNARPKSIAEKYLFDAQWYKKQLGDDAPDKKLYAHFVEMGSKADYSPHPLFDIPYYRAALGGNDIEGNPIEHFLNHGWRLGASCSKYFNVRFYLESYPDVAALGVNPLLHYLQHGANEGRKPNAAFDTAWYLLQDKSMLRAGVNPLAHWVAIGKQEGRSQNALEALAEHQRRIVVGSSTASADPNESIAIPSSLKPSQAPDVHGYREIPDVRLEKGLSYLHETSAKVLSFDVWDTLLRRKCHPDEIKLQTCRYIWIKYYWKLKPVYRSCASLYAARRTAEALSSPYGDWEFRLQDALLYFVNEVVERQVLDATRVQISGELFRHEISSEMNATVADETARDFVNAYSIKPLVAVTDFYMDAGTVEKLLVKNGYLPHRMSKIYSSSDYMANKRDGSLFPIVVNDFSIEAADVIHIGDNALVDVESARGRGLTAYHYVNHEIEQYKQWLSPAFDALLSGDASIHAARIGGLLDHVVNECSTAYGDATEQRSLFESGFHFAPVAIGMVLHVIEQAQRFDVSRVHFLTREGIFLKSVYDEVVKQDPYGIDYPVSELLEVSRLATFAPSLQKVDVPNLMRMWNLYSKQSPKAFCASLNLDLKAARRFFTKKTLSFDRPIKYPWQHEEFLEVLESKEFQDFAGTQIGEQKKLLKEYLHSRGLDGGDPATLLVDLGWRGTIQDNISHLVQQHVHGCYLALFKSFNTQPSNTSKAAWLFDLNRDPTRGEPAEIGPIEMLFNGAGGSVVGYAKTDEATVSAVKTVIAGEERIILGGVKHFQAGVIAAIPSLIAYVRLHGLRSDDIAKLGLDLFQETLNNPPPSVADLFMNLHHNETFGAGAAQNISSLLSVSKRQLGMLDGPTLHSSMKAMYDGTRWKAGLLRSDFLSSRLSRLSQQQKLALPGPIFNVMKGNAIKGKNIAFYVPAPLAGSGGHRTIFNLARKLSERGAAVNVFLEREGEGYDVARAYASDVPMNIEIGWQAHARADLAMATIAHSASFVGSLKYAKHKGYLVQDLEALFNPVGDAYREAEHSYTCVPNNFTIGNWLSHLINVQYGQSCVPAGLGIDTQTYFRTDDSVRENAICLLFQPEKPRRSPSMALNALRIVKSYLPDTKIYVFGSNAPLNVDFEVQNLGLIHDLNQLNALYNRCKLGLCISMSNPSRIPFEMMAAGTVPIDVYRYNNLFDYDSGTISLAYQSPFSLARAIVEQFTNEDGWKKRSNNCMNFAGVRSLEWENDILCNNINAMFAGDGLTGSEVARFV